MSDMMRRAFISLLGGTAIWPLTARAKKSSGLRRVGVVMGFAEDDEVWQTYLKTFRQALQDLGWAEGRNTRFDYGFGFLCKPERSEEQVLFQIENPAHVGVEFHAAECTALVEIADRIGLELGLFGKGMLAKILGAAGRAIAEVNGAVVVPP